METTEIARLNSIIDALITENRMLKNQIADDKKSNETRNIPFANDNNMIGNLTHLIANENILPGNLNYPLAEEKKMVGNLNVQIANDNSDYGKSNNITVEVKTVVPSEAHFSVLSKYLKEQGMKKSSLEGRTHAAKLLIYFYHQNRGDYKTLMKISGLSYFGLGKMIRSLKNRGWIIRSGWQQFTLTDAAKKMVGKGVFSILTRNSLSAR